MKSTVDVFHRCLTIVFSHKLKYPFSEPTVCVEAIHNRHSHYWPVSCVTDTPVALESFSAAPFAFLFYQWCQSHHCGTLDMSVICGPLYMPVICWLLDTSVTCWPLDMPVICGPLDTPVICGPLDMPVICGPLDMPILYMRNHLAPRHASHLAVIKTSRRRWLSICFYITCNQC